MQRKRLELELHFLTWHWLTEATSYMLCNKGNITSIVLLMPPIISKGQYSHFRWRLWISGAGDCVAGMHTIWEVLSQTEPSLNPIFLPIALHWCFMCICSLITRGTCLTVLGQYTWSASFLSDFAFCELAALENTVFDWNRMAQVCSILLYFI